MSRFFGRHSEGFDIARWTTSDDDVKQIARITQMVIDGTTFGGQIEIRLLNGNLFQGYCYGLASGNNAREATSGNARWSYYGALKVSVGQYDYEVDYLDIDYVRKF